MKNKIILMALLVSSLFIACNDDDYDAPNTFADTGWYTSLFRDAEMYIAVNNYISFSDLSQGTIDHSWTITPNSYFLEGPIERTDSIYDEFIVNPGSLVSTEETIHVLFKEPGLQNVNLYNTFKDSVAFRGYKKSYDDNDDNDYYVMPAVKVGDKWVIDTTFVVDVYDTIVPKILIRQNGEVVSHENESDVISIEAGDNLEFVDITTQGRPNTRQWNIAGYTKSDSVSTIVFKKLGDWTGTFNASRTGENIPAGYAKYDIPATFRVIPSSKPFELFGEIIELEDETIKIPFNGEFAPFVDQEEFFTVKVNDVEFVVESVTLNEDDATLLDLKLKDPIYRPDVITVSLEDGSALESTDTRSPVAFVDVPVIMHNVNLLDAVGASFEDEMGESWIYLPPWGNKGVVEFTTEKATHGNKSAKLDVTSGAPIFFESKNIPFNLYAGKSYTLTYDAFVEEGSTFNEWTLWLFPDWNNDKQWVGGSTVEQGKWVTMTMKYNPTEDKIGRNFGYRLISNSDTCVVYLDNFWLLEDEIRP